MLNLIVDRNHFTGMQSQIANQIALLIRSRVIKPGEVLASEARMAEHHQVSRNVVREAYRILKNKGLIKSDRRSRLGSIVVDNPHESGNAEYLRIRLSADLKEKIEVVSLFQKRNPDKLIEQVLRKKVEELFADFLTRYQSSDLAQPPLLDNNQFECGFSRQNK